MIKNIVFDIGGVLADFRIREFLMEKGLDVPTIKRVLKASVLNPYWGRFERGEVSEEETAAQALGLEGIVFHNYDALLAELRKAGVEINA